MKGFSIMTIIETKENQIKEYLHFNNDYEELVGIPNNIFEKLLNLVNSKQLKSQHVGFAFSYIYLQAYLFRYAKYDKVIPSTGVIKQLLGLSATNKTVDYIIKRNGLLDEHKITHTSSDFVLLSEMKDEILEFTYVSDLYEHEQFRESRNIGLSQSYKVPIFGLFANADDYFDEEYNDYDGTFYPFYDETSKPYTLIDNKVFAYMMANDDLGVNAFYLYCYVLYKNNLLSTGYDATHTRLAEEIGLSSKSVQRYRDAMRSYKVMDLIHNMDYFVHGLQDITKRMASSNFANDYKQFTYKKVEYDKQEKIGYKKFKELEKLKEQPEQNETKGKVEIDISQLPY